MNHGCLPLAGGAPGSPGRQHGVGPMLGTPRRFSKSPGSPLGSPRPNVAAARPLADQPCDAVAPEGEQRSIGGSLALDARSAVPLQPDMDNGFEHLSWTRIAGEGTWVFFPDRPSPSSPSASSRTALPVPRLHACPLARGEEVLPKAAAVTPARFASVKSSPRAPSASESFSAPKVTEPQRSPRIQDLHVQKNLDAALAERGVAISSNSSTREAYGAASIASHPGHCPRQTSSSIGRCSQEEDLQPQGGATAPLETETDTVSPKSYCSASTLAQAQESLSVLKQTLEEYSDLELHYELDDPFRRVGSPASLKRARRAIRRSDACAAEEMFASSPTTPSSFVEFGQLAARPPMCESSVSGWTTNYGPSLSACHSLDDPFHVGVLPAAESASSVEPTRRQPTMLEQTSQEPIALEEAAHYPASSSTTSVRGSISAVRAPEEPMCAGAQRHPAALYPVDGAHTGLPPHMGMHTELLPRGSILQEWLKDAGSLPASSHETPSLLTGHTLSELVELAAPRPLPRAEFPAVIVEDTLGVPGFAETLPGQAWAGSARLGSGQPPQHAEGSQCAANHCAASPAPRVLEPQHWHQRSPSPGQTPRGGSTPQQSPPSVRSFSMESGRKQMSCSPRLVLPPQRTSLTGLPFMAKASMSVEPMTPGRPVATIVQSASSPRLPPGQPVRYALPPRQSPRQHSESSIVPLVDLAPTLQQAE